MTELPGFDLNLHLQGSSSCGHCPSYLIFRENGFFCGLCYFQDGLESEVPTRLHQYRILAENGNPAMSEKFIAHIVMAMGLEGPKAGEPIKAFRRRRELLAREQYTRPAPRLFPFGSALWKMMGYQPPLAMALIPAAAGVPEERIAEQLQVSWYNVVERITKAISLGMRLLPDVCKPEPPSRRRGSASDAPGRDVWTGQESPGACQ